MAESVLLLAMGGILAGCAVNPESLDKQVSEEKVQKESPQKPDVELTGQQLIFKSDMEELTEKTVPDYALEKILKHYEGNKEVGGRIYTESEGLTSISYGEIGDKAVSMNENQAVAKADEWIGTAFIGFDISLLDNIKPIVGDMRKTQLGDESEESVIGYRIEYPNEYNGVRIQYEGVSVLLDDSGVLHGRIEWNQYKKIDLPENTKTAKKVDFEQSKILLANAITKENKELGLDENSEEARSVYKIELVFADNGEEEYIPFWYYEMEDGRTYYVNCIDGLVTGL